MNKDGQKDAVIQELESTLALLRTEYENTKRTIEEKKNHLDTIYQDISSIQRTLSIRRRQLHLPDMPEDSTDPLIDDAQSETSPKKKTNFVLSLIKKNGSLGTTTKDIFDAFDMTGEKYYKNYIYTILLRLKRQGKITEKGGKYFLAG